MDEAIQSVRPPGRGNARLWVLVFAAAAALYLATAQRGPAWQDGGDFQVRMHTLDLTHPRGLALVHPLLIVLGRLAEAVPVGPVCWRLSALSALAAAVAAANLALLVRWLAPGARASGWFAAGVFGLAHTVWWLATIAEDLAPLAALLSGELLALAALARRPRWWLVVLLGLLNGLGVSVHNLAFLALPGYGLAVAILAARRRLAWWAVPVFVASWCAGASLWIGLLVGEALRVGPVAALGSALFGAYGRKAIPGSLRLAPLGLAYVLYNFPNLALPAAAVGLCRLRRRAGALLAGVLTYALLAHFVFVIRYDVPDQFMFFAPFYLLVALLAGLGLTALAEKRRWLPAAALATLALGPVAYRVFPKAAKAAGLPLPGRTRTLPFRDHARYWLTPWKHNEDSAGQFAREALKQLRNAPQPALLYADSTSYPPLWWAQHVEGLGGTARLVGHNDPLLGGLKSDPESFWRPVREQGGSVWVVSNVPGYCPSELLERADAKPTGVLYRVRLPAPPRPHTAPVSRGGPGGAAARGAAGASEAPTAAAPSTE